MCWGCNIFKEGYLTIESACVHEHGRFLDTMRLRRANLVSRGLSSFPGASVTRQTHAYHEPVVHNIDVILWNLTFSKPTEDYRQAFQLDHCVIRGEGSITVWSMQMTYWHCVTVLALLWCIIWYQLIIQLWYLSSLCLCSLVVNFYKTLFCNSNINFCKVLVFMASKPF